MNGGSEGAMSSAFINCEKRVKKTPNTLNRIGSIKIMGINVTNENKE